jgi:uncharacterized protein
MANIPRIIREAWEDRDGPTVLATVSNEGVPNIIYVKSVSIFGEDRFVVADNYFDKTRRNIHEGCKGAVLFIDKTGKSFHLKGTLEYHKDGEIFLHMKATNPPQHPGHAAVALVVEESYSGSEVLV